jgi:cytochrome P450
MLTEIIWTICKYTLLVFIAFVVYFFYNFLYIPWRIRKRYLKYPNVSLWDKFYPFLGDLGSLQKRRENQEYQFYDYIDTALKSNCDVKVQLLGQKHSFQIMSIKGMQEMISMWPDKIDRHTGEWTPVWYILRNTFLMTPSSKNWQQRRNAATRLIGMNNLSKYVPMMIKEVDRVMKRYEEGKSFSYEGKDTNLTVLIKEMSFGIICKILFGRDILDLEKLVDYVDIKTGEVRQITFENTIYQFAHDMMAHFTIIKANIFPFLEHYNLIYPFKATNKNAATIKREIRNFCEKSEDQESIFNQMKKAGQYDDIEEVYSDILGLLGAGMDTTSTAAASALYLLKKSKKDAKLIKEMDKFGLGVLRKSTDCSFIKSDSSDKPSDVISDEEFLTLSSKIQDCDYLTYSVKESLRLDNSAFFSIRYYAKQNIEIWGVPIDKGSHIIINSIGPGFDPNQWHRPTEYLPERFNPEDQLFLRPDGQGSRHPLSWWAFSAGQRSCPGQTMAQMEMKVILARFLYITDYWIREDLLSNEKAKFGMHSQMDLIGGCKRN